MVSISFLPIKFSKKNILNLLANHIATHFNISVSVLDAEFDYKYSYDPARRQYHSTQLLKGLTNYIDAPRKIIGITELDLYIPILTFVFGEAQLGGEASIVSTFRLDPKFYGLPADEKLIIERLKKEAIHELGHTFGLPHCIDYRCVLCSSTCVEEIDIKNDDFCFDCYQEFNKRRNGTNRE